MNKFLLVVLAVLALLNSASGQTREGSLTSRVVNAVTKEPLSRATASLVLLKDSSLVNIGLTNDNSSVELGNIETGEYNFFVSFTGYQSYRTKISISAASMNVMLPDILLWPVEIALKEVTVTAEIAPIVIKKDTIEFNASSFAIQADDNAEALLRKIPGITVSAQGFISINGNPVKKIIS